MAAIPPTALIPVLGTIPADQLVDATENVLGYLEVDPRLFGSPPLKRYLALEEAPCLKVENLNHPDLVPARELLLQGVCLGLLRSIPTIIAS